LILQAVGEGHRHFVAVGRFGHSAFFELGLLCRVHGACRALSNALFARGFRVFTNQFFLGVFIFMLEARLTAHSRLSGVVGGLSGIFRHLVVTANAWMNSPLVQMVDGKIADIDPMAAMLNPPLS